MVEVDIQVPYWDANLRERMKEFPPVFKNTDISIDDIGETMAEFARSNGLLNKPRRALIGSYFAEKQLKLEHGLIITRVYQALEYIPKSVFSHLTSEVVEHRKRADADLAFAAYGQLFKLLGNSYYGRCMVDRTRHSDVKYQTRKEAARSICQPLFRKVEEIDDDLYETHMAKSRIVYDLPINIAFFVYAYAKCRMLEYYYDWLTQILPNNRFELCEMDTDSFYYGLSHPTLDEAVPEDRKHIYEMLKARYIACQPADNRTTGLFKKEFMGLGMISVNSKTYIAYSRDAEGKAVDIKISTKGINKSINQLTIEDFQAVLANRGPVSGVNRGFRVHNKKLYQYSQHRVGLSFLYIKRKVNPDGITTEPLEI